MSKKPFASISSVRSATAPACIMESMRSEPWREKMSGRSPVATMDLSLTLSSAGIASSSNVTQGISSLRHSTA